MSRKTLNAEQEKEVDRLARASGVKGGAIGIGLGLVAAAMTFRRSPQFRSLSLPMQAILPASGGMAGYLFAADRVATQYANKVLGYVDDDVIRELETDAPDSVSSKDHVLRLINKHRWEIIGGSWALSMAGAIAYTFSNRYLSTQQKLLQARMYAQAVTIAVLMASAGVSIYVGEDKHKIKDAPDEELRAVLNMPYQQSRAVRAPQAASPNENA